VAVPDGAGIAPPSAIPPPPPPACPATLPGAVGADVVVEAAGAVELLLLHPVTGSARPSKAPTTASFCFIVFMSYYGTWPNMEFRSPHRYVSGFVSRTACSATPGPKFVPWYRAFTFMNFTCPSTHPTFMPSVGRSMANPVKPGFGPGLAQSQPPSTPLYQVQVWVAG